MSYMKIIISIMTLFSVFFFCTVKTTASDKGNILEEQEQKQKDHSMMDKKDIDQGDTTTGGWFRKTIREGARQMRSDYDSLIQAGKDVGTNITEAGKNVKKSAIEDYEDAREKFTREK